MNRSCGSEAHGKQTDYLGGDLRVMASEVPDMATLHSKVQQLEEARGKKDFLAADIVRRELLELGVWYRPLVYTPREAWPVCEGKDVEGLTPDVEARLFERDILRAKKEFEAADEIRAQLKKEMGVHVSDRLRQWMFRERRRW